MMYELKERIAKATRKKQLDKILIQALQQFGFFSNEYAEILNLCVKKLEEIKGEKLC